MKTWAHIGRQIRQAREEKGWSQRELAARFGVSSATATRWEGGLQPVDFPDLEHLANLLEKPVQFFLPGWYVDPSGLSPELAQLVNRINQLPHGAVRDKLIRNILDQVENVSLALDRSSGRAGEQR